MGGLCQEDRRLLPALEMIQAVYRRFGGTLEQEEYEANAWLAYVEARLSYPAFAGCCEWEAYLYRRLQEAAEEMKRQRSRRISRESPLSLDQTAGNSAQPVIAFLRHPNQGDFTRGVDFWDYIRRLGLEKYRMVRGFCGKETDQEIMVCLRMPQNRFYRLKRELRADMEAYLNI